jgi:hypothetical protein
MAQKHRHESSKIKFIKVRVQDLLPNPFRDLQRDPTDEAKVEELVKSMRDTGIFGTFDVRRSPTQSGKFEIHWGHHRLEALRRIMRDGEVWVRVLDLPNPDMIRRAANENSSAWQILPRTALEGIVRTPRRFLIEHPEVLNAAREAAVAQGRPFPAQPKSGNPGAETIAAFLGGVWSEARIKYLLDIVNPIENGEIDEECLLKLPTLSLMHDFAREYRNLSLDEQRLGVARILRMKRTHPRNKERHSPLEKSRNADGTLPTNIRCPKCKYSWDEPRLRGARSLDSPLRRVTDQERGNKTSRKRPR